LGKLLLDGRAQLVRDNPAIRMVWVAKSPDMAIDQPAQHANGYADLETGGVLKCRSCRKGRHAPYRWVHPDEER
jgi:hypothetical protein